MSPVGWPCRAAAFGFAKSISAEHFRYRPDHACEDYLPARKRGEGDVWHPVKSRGCYVRWLEARDEKIGSLIK